VGGVKGRLDCGSGTPHPQPGSAGDDDVFGLNAADVLDRQSRRGSSAAAGSQLVSSTSASARGQAAGKNCRPVSLLEIPMRCFVFPRLLSLEDEVGIGTRRLGRGEPPRTTSARPGSPPTTAFHLDDLCRPQSAKGYTGSQARKVHEASLDGPRTPLSHAWSSVHPFSGVFSIFR